MVKFKVGDKVKTLQKSYYGKYEIGSIGVISDVDFPCEDGLERIVVDYGNNQDGLYSESDLELVERKKTEDQRITELESQVEMLKDRVEQYGQLTESLIKQVESLEFVLADKSKITVTKRNPILVDETKLTSNQQRAMIIRKAKQFVKENTPKASRIIGRQVVVDFYTNENRRTVTCVIRGLFTSKFCGKGIAKCNPDDVFNEDLGKAIALGRALNLDVSEFENAVRPDEVEVGQIYEYFNKDLSIREIHEITKLEDGRCFFNNGDKQREFHYHKINRFYEDDSKLTLIDDTNAQYEVM